MSADPQRVDNIFHRARKLPIPERAEFLAEECAGDEDLRREVESLLAYHNPADNSLDIAMNERRTLELTDAFASPSKPASGPLLVGRYQIIDKLGAGGMGEVHRALDQSLSREIAVKLTRDPNVFARFEREAKICATFSHPNIIVIHDYGKMQGLAYAVMEKLMGETLRDRLRRSKPSIEEALKIGEAIAEGLAVIHSSRVVHRDLKPENIFLTTEWETKRPAEGGVKILDFGIACWEANAPGLPPDRPDLQYTKLTAPAALIGTPAYMSPEQAACEKLDVRSDIFSFGIMLYEMISGSHPFLGSGNNVMAAILREEPPKLPQIPPLSERLIMRCLEKNPKDRYPSGRELKEALKEGAKSLASPTIDTGHGQEVHRTVTNQKAPIEDQKPHTRNSNPTTESMSDLPPGYTFAGRYQIMQKLGSGGMGIVYEAVDTTIDERIALKTLSPEFVENHEIYQRFKHKMAWARQINHPNIIRLLDFGEWSLSGRITAYYTMEMLADQDLAQMLETGGLPAITKVCNILGQLCSALQPAHKAGVIHSNIKPQNVFVSPDMQVKLSDFGIAVSGAGQYMPPEQFWGGKQLDERGDLYSLGVLVYELLTGVLPFAGRKSWGPDVIYDRDITLSLRDLRQDTPKWLDQMVRQLLAEKPEDRPESVDMVMREIDFQTKEDERQLIERYRNVLYSPEMRKFCNAHGLVKEHRKAINDLSLGRTETAKELLKRYSSAQTK